MQIKKDEVQQAILKEAEQEFLEKGFLNASLRKIVKAAGTTIGNFYNYFENKEALFDALVKEEYQVFIHFMNHHDEVEQPNHLWDTKDIRVWRQVLMQLINDMLPVFSNGFILLIECSQGTSYENTRDLLTHLLSNHFIEHLQAYGNDTIDPKLAEVIALQILEGFLLILKKYKDKKLRQRLLTEHLLYHFLGTMALIGDW